MQRLVAVVRRLSHLGEGRVLESAPDRRLRRARTGRARAADRVVVRNVARLRRRRCVQQLTRRNPAATPASRPYALFASLSSCRA